MGAEQENIYPCFIYYDPFVCPGFLQEAHHDSPPDQHTAVLLYCALLRLSKCFTNFQAVEPQYSKGQDLQIQTTHTKNTLILRKPGDSLPETLSAEFGVLMPSPELQHLQQHVPAPAGAQRCYSPATHLLSSTLFHASIRRPLQ